MNGPIDSRPERGPEYPNLFTSKIISGKISDLIRSANSEPGAPALRVISGSAEFSGYLYKRREQVVAAGNGLLIARRVKYRTFDDDLKVNRKSYPIFQDTLYGFDFLGQKVLVGYMLYRYPTGHIVPLIQMKQGEKRQDDAHVNSPIIFSPEEQEDIAEAFGIDLTGNL